MNTGSAMQRISSSSSIPSFVPNAAATDVVEEIAALLDRYGDDARPDLDDYASDVLQQVLASPACPSNVREAVEREVANRAGGVTSTLGALAHLSMTDAIGNRAATLEPVFEVPPQDADRAVEYTSDELEFALAADTIVPLLELRPALQPHLDSLGSGAVRELLEIEQLAGGPARSSREIRQARQAKTTGPYEGVNLQTLMAMATPGALQLLFFTLNRRYNSQADVDTKQCLPTIARLVLAGGPPPALPVDSVGHQMQQIAAGFAPGGGRWNVETLVDAAYQQILAAVEQPR